MKNNNMLRLAGEILVGLVILLVVGKLCSVIAGILLAAVAVTSSLIITILAILIRYMVPLLVIGILGYAFYRHNH